MMKVDEATLRAIAVQASCDPRTVQKILRGLPVRGLPGHRARAALTAAGLIADAGTATVPAAGGRP